MERLQIYSKVHDSTDTIDANMSDISIRIINTPNTSILSNKVFDTIIPNISIFRTSNTN